MQAKAWLSKGFGCLTVVLAMAPLPLLAAVAGGAAPLYAPMGLYALAMLLIAAVGVGFPKRRLVLGGIVVAASLALAGYMAWQLAFWNVWAIVFGVVLLAACAFLLRATPLPAGSELSAQQLFIGGGVHLALVVASRLEGMRGAAPWLSWLTPLYFLCLALILNEMTLTDGVAMRRGGKPPSRIVSRNRIMIVGFALATLFVVNLHRVRDAVYWVAGKVWDLILWIIWLIGALYPADVSEGGGGGEGGMDLSGLGEASEPSWFALLMEQVFKVVAVVLLAVVLCFVLWKLGKLLRKLFAMLKDRFAQYAASLGESYEDEAESVFDWGELTQATGERLQAMLARVRVRRPKWGEMDNRQRMRYAYRTLLKKRPNVPASKTARATLLNGDLPVGQADAKAFADAYDAARYSDAQVSDADAENARRALE